LPHFGPPHARRDDWARTAAVRRGRVPDILLAAGRILTSTLCGDALRPPTQGNLHVSRRLDRRHRPVAWSIACPGRRPRQRGQNEGGQGCRAARRPGAGPGQLRHRRQHRPQPARGGGGSERRSVGAGIARRPREKEARPQRR
jgi:hypothetical protein